MTFIFGGYFLIGNYLLKKGKIPNRSEATLFRSTGMVHYFPGKNKDPIIKPYREYDCSISQTSGVKGGAYLSLWMSNRYDKKIKFGLPNQPGSIFSARVTAEMIECFMDISRPLPDVPELELYRPYDPVTAAWDKKYERPSRLFRDMSKETWDKLKDATWRYAETYPWGKDRKTAIAMGWQPPPRQWWKMADDPS